MVDFLEDLGVASDDIVCTSVPDHLIPNGQKIYDWLRSQFTDYNLHMLFLLSDHYYASPDCLNEMGAAWVTKSYADVILLPGFSSKKIRGCIGADTMAIECDGRDDILKDRIKQLRNKVCGEFGLPIPTDRRWEIIRDSTISKLRTKKETDTGLLGLLRKLFAATNVYVKAANNGRHVEEQKAFQSIMSCVNEINEYSDNYLDKNSAEERIAGNTVALYNDLAKAFLKLQEQAEKGVKNLTDAETDVKIAFSVFQHYVAGEIHVLE